VPVEFNHTIVAAADARATAEFLASVLGLQVGPPYGRFLPVITSNGVTLDIAETDQDPIPTQHYAFLVGDDEFDEIFARIRAAGIPYYADPHHRQPGRINHRDGGRGLYFDDPNGHNLEILTRPYGSTA
jgi:catechol 2,3-dioxygenase-like lactoylglutathione lyase family enzyme